MSLMMEIADSQTGLSELCTVLHVSRQTSTGMNYQHFVEVVAGLPESRLLLPGKREQEIGKLS
jgi:hypothetical protein